MLGKLLKSKKPPQNDGDSNKAMPEDLRTVKFFELELSNMENSPSYAITHQLTIGREIGNIIINDPSIAPRHATFALHDEVLSVMDHGTGNATKINGKEIPAGRYIILEESDVISIGDLEVRIRVTENRAPKEHIPDIPVDATSPKAVMMMDLPIAQREDLKLEEVKKSKKKAGPQKIVTEDPTEASNSLMRILAFICDMLICYIILVLFEPFDEFRGFLDFVPAEVNRMLAIDWNLLWQNFTKEQGFIGEALNDLLPFLAGLWNVGPVFILLAILRFVTTLLLGVSVAEYLVGMRGAGNKIWMRIGGGLRVLLGLITGPFLIFDAPSVFSKRTLKEFITFTRVFTLTKLGGWVGAFVFLPLLIVLALVSPLYQGLETSESIVVDPKIDQRIKANNETDTTQETKIASNFLNLEISYDASDVSIMPMIKFKGIQNKLSLQPQLLYFFRDVQRPVLMELVKTFDMKQLIGLGMKGNFFLYDKYPELYTFVYEAGHNPSFKINKSEESEEKFANEFIGFTKLALGLGMENVFDQMQGYTLLLKGLIDYKASLLSLIEYKDFDRVGFIKIGNVVFLKVSYNKQKPFDLIIPLMKGEGRIFKVSFDSRDNLQHVSSKFYKFALENADWIRSTEETHSEVMTPFQVIDLFSALGPKKKTISPENGQAFYGYFYETSAAIFKLGNAQEIEQWKAAVFSAYKVIETLSVQNEAAANPEVENPVRKLFENFRDLNDAVENKNYDYFGISNSTSI